VSFAKFDIIATYAYAKGIFDGLWAKITGEQFQERAKSRFGRGERRHLASGVSARMSRSRIASGFAGLTR
jgi:hypothetical protein